MRGKDDQSAGRARRLRRAKPGIPSLEAPAQSPAGWVQIRAAGGDRRYFADFVCRERRLVVELDGVTHVGNIGDERRDRELAELGYRVVRVWNNQVVEGVLQCC